MPRLLQALLEAGLDPNQANPAREPLLHEAIASFEQSRHGWSGIAVPQMIASLIRAGADLRARGDGDFTPLHTAAHRANEAICLQLISAGADPKALAEPDDLDGGCTPYEVAEFYGRRGVAAIIKSVLTPEQLERRREQREEARRAYLRSIRSGRTD